MPRRAPVEPEVVDAEALARFAQRVLEHVGVPPEDAARVADCLVAADLSGVDSHGVVRLAHYVRRLQNGTIKARPDITFERTAPGLGVVDGGDGLGHVVTFHACGRAAELCREAGTSAVVVRNSGHFGMAGYYVRRLTEQGLAGMVMTTTDALLIPFGGSKPFFGTNPVAIGFPTDGMPLILDMATTSIPYGKVALAMKEKRPIPPEWAFDEDGQPTSDPARAAGLHPIAGPKGSGLAMVIDIFCSLLSDAPFGPHINKMYGEIDRPRGLGHFIAAWDVSRLMPLSAFKARLSQMIDELHDVPAAEGLTRVYYPGELEGLRREQNRAEGVAIEPGLYAELRKLGETLGAPFPS